MNSQYSLQNMQTQLGNLGSQFEQLKQLMGQYQPAMQAPQQLQPQQQALPQMVVQTVDGLSGAKEFLERMPANSSAAPFDKNEDMFYFLSKDANGIPAKIKIGKFVAEDAPEPESEYVSRKDFETLRNDIHELQNVMAELVSRKPVVETEVKHEHFVPVATKDERIGRNGE